MRNVMLAVAVAMLVGFAGPVAAQDGVQTAKQKADAAWVAAMTAYDVMGVSRAAADGTKEDAAAIGKTAETDDWVPNILWYALTMKTADYDTCAANFLYAGKAEANGLAAYGQGIAARDWGDIYYAAADGYYAAGNYEMAASHYAQAGECYAGAGVWFDGATDFYVLAFLYRLEAAMIMSQYPLPPGGGGEGQ